MDNLKPCPFCGKDHPIYKSAPIIGYRGEDGVPINGIWRDFVSLQEHGDEITPETWNTRPREAELEARIAELESERDTQRIGRSAESIFGEYHDLRIKLDEWKTLVEDLSCQLESAKAALKLANHEALTNHIAAVEISRIRSEELADLEALLTACGFEVVIYYDGRLAIEGHGLIYPQGGTYPTKTKENK